jgi:hypothetical protein
VGILKEDAMDYNILDTEPVPEAQPIPLAIAEWCNTLCPYKGEDVCPECVCPTKG